jgi:hypothetical protein
MENLQPSFTTSVRSNTQGEWLQGIEKQLSPGMHRVVATDEQGNHDEALLYVVKQEPGIIQQVTTSIPPIVAWLIICLLAAILLLSGYAIRLGQVANSKKAEVKTKRRRATHAILVSLALISIAVGLSYWTNLRTRGKLLAQIIPETKQEASRISVQGAIKKPFSGQGFAGVDLQIDQTSIHTVEGGHFQFSGVEQKNGLKITHPELKIALRKSIEDENMDILFDPKLFNVLFELMQREARGRTTPEDGPAIYTDADRMSQELLVGTVKQQGDRISVELWSKQSSKTCVLTQAGNEWNLRECK